jgi:integrase
MKLTTSSVAALILPPGKIDSIFWDDELPGFGVRLRGSNKIWVCQYRTASQQRRESLGDVRKVRLDDARKIARQRFALVELGADPAAEKAKARADAAAARLTLGNVAERYLDARKHRLRPSSYAAAQRYFGTHCKPLLNRPIGTIKRSDVAARLQELVKAHGRASASKARANLSALFGWAMREGLVESNVVIATNDPAEGIASRERVLDAGEVRAILGACEDDDFGKIVRLLLLTGQRRNEIAALRWSEINFDKAIIAMPPARTKNKKHHTVPLSNAALSIIRAHARHVDADGTARDLLFGKRRKGFTTWSNSKRNLDAAIAKAFGMPLPRWTLHDLRRTAATRMADLGVQPHVIEAALNHTSGSKAGVAGVYNRSSYEPEKRAALDRWAEHLMALVENRRSNVTPLKRA